MNLIINKLLIKQLWVVEKQDNSGFVALCEKLYEKWHFTFYINLSNYRTSMFAVFEIYNVSFFYTPKMQLNA